MLNAKWLNCGFFLLFVGLASCQTVECTGRSQVNLISDSQEKQLGTEAYADILKKTPISKRSDWQAQLQRVGQRIAAAAARPDYQWEYRFTAWAHLLASFFRGVEPRSLKQIASALS